MPPTRVEARVTGGVGHIRFIRSSAGNAIDLEFAREFEAAVEEVARAETHAVLVTAAGRYFCVGGDLRAFSAERPLAPYLNLVTTHLHAGIEMLAGLPAPVVAAVQGPLAGAGLGLICSADLVLASPEATFVAAYTAIGLSPDASVSYFLPRLVGIRRALELTLTNRTLSVQEAVEWGLVTRVVDGRELRAEANRLAQELSRGPASSLSHTKKLLWASENSDLFAHLAKEAEVLATCVRTPDGIEGIMSFVERRQPSFAPWQPPESDTTR